MNQQTAEADVGHNRRNLAVLDAPLTFDDVNMSYCSGLKFKSNKPRTMFIAQARRSSKEFKIVSSEETGKLIIEMGH
jgi:hypothetical protein